MERRQDDRSVDEPTDPEGRLQRGSLLVDRAHRSEVERRVEEKVAPVGGRLVAGAIEVVVDERAAVARRTVAGEFEPMRPLQHKTVQDRFAKCQFVERQL